MKRSHRRDARRWRCAVALSVLVGTIGVGGAPGATHDSPGRSEGQRASVLEDMLKVRPRTLIPLDDPVAAFAQDGSHVAWSGGSNNVQLVDLRSHRRTVLRRVTRYPRPVVGFALAGRRVLLAELMAPCGNTRCFIRMWTASVDDRRLRRIGPELLCGPDVYVVKCDLLPVAGDRRSLVYYAHCPVTDECRAAVVTEIHRVSGHVSLKVAEVGKYVFALAASGDRTAVSELVVVSESEFYEQVSVLETTTGKTVANLFRFEGYEGHVEAVALSSTRVVALVSRAGRRRQIEVRRYPDGRLERSVAVPRATAPEISLSGRSVVFRSGRTLEDARTIRLLNLSTGRVRVVATTPAIPIGLSLEGRRVAWAENISSGGRIQGGRIQAVVLPR